jgi:hypothetical protein
LIGAQTLTIKTFHYINNFQIDIICVCFEHYYTSFLVGLLNGRSIVKGSECRTRILGNLLRSIFHSVIHVRSWAQKYIYCQISAHHPQISKQNFCYPFTLLALFSRDFVPNIQVSIMQYIEKLVSLKEVTHKNRKEWDNFVPNVVSWFSDPYYNEPPSGVNVYFLKIPQPALSFRALVK